MPKPSTPSVWASGKTFGFQPSAAQQAQGFDYIATVRPSTGSPITDDHDWPLNNITTSLKWVMDQLPDGGIQALLTALLPKRTFAASDFIRIPDVPGGLIIQWGRVGYTSNPTNPVVTFPVRFTNKCTAVVGFEIGTQVSAGFSVINAITPGPSVNGVNLTSRKPDGTLSSQADIMWIAIGD